MVEGFGWVLLFLLSVIVLLLLLFFLLLLFLLLAAHILFNFLFKFDVDRDAIVLPEVPWNGDLNDGWVELEVEENLVQVDVERSGSWVEQYHVLFDLANAANSGLEYLLDVYTLLRV